MNFLFSEIKNFRNLDYVCTFFYLGAKFIKNKNNVKLGFVSTNSICQGSQVSIFWPNILKLNVEINFAYKSFKWTNNARKKAAVSCVIIGLSQSSNDKKILFEESISHKVKNINHYLLDYKNIFVYSRNKPLSNIIPPICFGSMPNDNGNLLLYDNDRKNLINEYPESKKFIREVLGAREFVDKSKRWCIWLNNYKYDDYKEIKPIIDRIKKVELYRKNSTRKATKKLANIPHLFGEIRHKTDYQ